MNGCKSMIFLITDRWVIPDNKRSDDDGKKTFYVKLYIVITIQFE